MTASSSDGNIIEGLDDDLLFAQIDAFAQKSLPKFQDAAACDSVSASVMTAKPKWKTSSTGSDRRHDLIDDELEIDVQRKRVRDFCLGVRKVFEEQFDSSYVMKILIGSNTASAKHVRIAKTANMPAPTTPPGAFRCCKCDLHVRSAKGS